jgi:hypothetical protein
MLNTRTLDVLTNKMPRHDSIKHPRHAKQQKRLDTLNISTLDMINTTNNLGNNKHPRHATRTQPRHAKIEHPRHANRKHA